MTKRTAQRASIIRAITTLPVPRAKRSTSNHPTLIYSNSQTLFFRFQSLSFQKTLGVRLVGVRFRNTEKIFGPWIRKWSIREKKLQHSPSTTLTGSRAVFKNY